MATTFIKTGDCPRRSVAGAGDVAEVINETLCGAKNVLAKLHWLRGGEQLKADAKVGTHELLYVMEGNAIITLNHKDYPVKKGAGVYLGPNEAAAIKPGGKDDIKLFHLVVPETTD